MVPRENGHYLEHYAASGGRGGEQTGAHILVGDWRLIVRLCDASYWGRIQCGAHKGNFSHGQVLVRLLHHKPLLHGSAASSSQ
jgi:hypothetical protein